MSGDASAQPTPHAPPPASPPPAVTRRAIADTDMPVARERDEDGSWILSYVDLFTLLLVMFVVMLTFSTPGEQAAAPADAGQHALLNRFQHQLAGLVEKGQIEIASSAAGVTLQLEEEILFASGAAELLGEGAAVLSELAPALQQSGQAITVEGHSDNVPIATARFPSNWELSGARAARVARYLIEQGLPATRINFTGYADTRPMADNDTPAGRARNRRVTLLVRPAD